VIGQSLEGRDLELLTVGTGKVCRLYHPTVGRLPKLVDCISIERRCSLYHPAVGRLPKLVDCI
jgi:hypothetical protein